MAQFEVHGRAEHPRPIRAGPSDALHRAAVEGLGLPGVERFHRSFPTGAEDPPTPDGR